MSDTRQNSHKDEQLICETLASLKETISRYKEYIEAGEMLYDPMGRVISTESVSTLEKTIHLLSKSIRINIDTEQELPVTLPDDTIAYYPAKMLVVFCSPDVFEGFKHDAVIKELNNALYIV